MRKTFILMLTAFLAVVLAHGFAEAGAPCVDCHTMHYSQNGQKPPLADPGGPFDKLLLASGCLGCHAKGGGGATNISADGTPQVIHSQNDGTGDGSSDLAGGNFGYITGKKSLDGTDGGANQNSVGHNVIDLGASYYENNIPSAAASFPPGDQNGNFGNGLTRTTFTCAGKYGCHGVRTEPNALNAMTGAHHADRAMLRFGGPIDESTQGLTVGHSYRFLLGVHGGEDSDWQATVSSTDHNEYKGAISQGTESTITSPGGGTISGLCAECHGYFHGPNTGDISDGSSPPWLRHPTDIILPSDTAKEYYLYNLGNGSNNTYSIYAPVARATIPTDSSKSAVTPGTDNSIVMCLSCHKAHATANADILRWNYEDIQVGVGGNEKCFICHTGKNKG